MAGEEIALVEIGVIVAVALFVGFVFARFKQNSAIGYILAGIILGPLGLHFLVPGHGLAQVFGEIGLLMLLFYLGLELNIRHFIEHGAPAVVLAAVEMVLTFAGGFLVAKLFGFPDIEALVIGGILMATSTAIVGKFLIDRKLFGKPSGNVAHSILVLKDFVAILLLVFIVSIAEHQSFNSVALTALFFVIAVFFVVARFSRKVLKFLRAESAAAVALYAVAVGIIVAWIGVFLGLPSTLGAYFTGIALADTIYGKRIKEDLGLLREFFVLFFFVSFGSTLFFDTALQAVVIPPLGQWMFLLSVVVALVAVYLLVKLFAYGVFGTALGFKPRTALGVGFLLVPLGEFAVIIALASKPLLAPVAFTLLLPLTFLLILFTAPLMAPLFDRSEKASKWFERFYPSKVRGKLSVIGAELRALERFSKTEAKTYVGHALVKLAVNFLTVVAIVYISNQLSLEVGIPAAGVQIPVSAVILLFVVWPLYNVVRELRDLVRFSTLHLLKGAGVKPSPEEHRAVRILTVTLLFAAGVIASILLYSIYPARVFIWAVPIGFTLISAVELARTVFSHPSRG